MSMKSLVSSHLKGVGRARRWLGVGLLAAGSLCGFRLEAAALPAFPGAEGFGARAVGGRSGRVIEVTNLNDSGPGSFRAAVEAKGPRMVVFRTGGTITLRSGIAIKNPYITIAGQTAPGGGITLRNDPSGRSSIPLEIWTHDVIVRYLRFRPGPPSRKAKEGDALDIRAGHNIIIDHCSLSWSIDEVLTTWSEWHEPGEIHEVTIQWCIISEALHDSMHKKGPHGMGLLLGRKTTRISVHHNLLAHNDERNPRIPSGTVDFVNNVIYNYGTYACWATFDSRDHPVRLNFVGNFIKPGVNSKRSTPGVVVPRRGDLGIYVADNIGPYRTDPTKSDWLIVGRWRGPRDGVTKKYQARKRFDAPTVTTMGAREAYEKVLAGVGCTIPRRDPVDRRVVDDVKNGTGKIINHPSEVGGWPRLAAGSPATDTDRDGMPDEWEAQRGLDPRDASDGRKDRDGDGYTNVEEYINGLVACDQTSSVSTPTVGMVGR